MATTHSWRYYEQLRPDELAQLVKQTPIAYWPLGLLEHHGWHLPVGYDGLKASAICTRIAERTGGVMLPVMWWGGEGGHGGFLWTLYQSPDAARMIVLNTVERLIQYGFRVIVLLMGHYPWVEIAGTSLDELQKKYPHTLILWGTEANIGRPELLLPGDHAARWETSYGLALLPEYIDMNQLKAGRDATAWPSLKPVEPDQQYPGVRYDPNDALFAQLGEPASLATVDDGERELGRLCEWLVSRISSYLQK